MNDPIIVWNNILSLIKGSVPKENFRKWFEPIVPIKLVDQALTIQVPNKFFYDWIESNFLALLRSCVRKELGDKGKLEYQILMEDYQKPGFKAKSSKSHSNDFNNPEAITNPFVIPGIRKIKIESNLSPNYLFDNFIEGNCNRVARQAGMHIAQKPGNMFNPLVIYGNAALGKSHLMQAIGNGIQKNHPEKNIVYTNAEKFTSQFITAVKNNSVSEFSNFYQSMDVLLLDDIQFFAGKSGTQEIFFHLFNQLHQTGKQIVLASDKAPKDLADIEERLISRFKWGLTADLTMPDFETRMAILLSKMELGHIQLPDNVMEFICQNIKSNIRELEGVLIRIIAETSLNFRKIDVELAKEVVQNYVNQVNQELTVESIVKIVCDQYKLPLERLIGKSRQRQIVIARQTAMYFIKQYTQRSLKQIGEFFGGKDHATVLYSCNMAKYLIDSDPAFRERAENIEKKIQKSQRIK
ncbi:MAG: chromosomal replication initiator protein DnaA [Saprospiraceae bacterium]|nr:chromosomal replication initiator protein DnaA [Saprospiraceae bacterium]MBK8486082.1 chromosomal replication initiator protein DnaA [Saprospiraceae bacterium]MBK9221128.1 chromosomal replication initiator protein DnaA [Saprospiraceae bacterium]MBK9722020.1 chromosomal replication initiator protein DnaA [Saprospiraceae bacterium]MBK9729067.1 chromosomal replication initiator protein DnaA [Saprospiraceae bacterium]